MSEKVRAEFRFRNAFRSVEEWVDSKEKAMEREKGLANLISDGNDDTVFANAFAHFDEYVDNIFSTDQKLKDYLHGNHRDQQRAFDSTFHANVYNHASAVPPATTTLPTTPTATSNRQFQFKGGLNTNSPTTGSPNFNKNRNTFTIPALVVSSSMLPHKSSSLPRASTTAAKSRSPPASRIMMTLAPSMNEQQQQQQQQQLQSQRGPQQFNSASNSILLNTTMNLNSRKSATAAEGVVRNKIVFNNNQMGKGVYQQQQHQLQPLLVNSAGTIPGGILKKQQQQVGGINTTNTTVMFEEPDGRDDSMMFNRQYGDYYSYSQQNRFDHEFESMKMPDDSKNVREFLQGTDEQLKKVENDVLNSHFLNSKTLFEDSNRCWTTGGINNNNNNNSNRMVRSITSKLMGGSAAAAAGSPSIYPMYQQSKNSMLQRNVQTSTSPKRVLVKQQHQHLEASILKLFGLLRNEELQNKKKTNPDVNCSLAAGEDISMNTTNGNINPNNTSKESNINNSGGDNLDLKLPLLSIQILNMLFEQSADPVFRALSIIMQKYVFCFDSTLLAKLPQILKINLSTKKYSFWELSLELCRQVESMKEAREEKEHVMAAKINELDESVRVKDTQIVEARRGIESVQKACDDSFLAERSALLESIQAKNKEISSLSDELSVLMKQVKTQEGIFLQIQTELKLQIRHAEADFTAKNTALQTTIDNLNADNFAQANQMFIMRDSYATQLISIRTFKDRIRDLENKMSLIVEENHRLNARAGTNFFELTPRPSFESIDAIIAPAASTATGVNATASGTTDQQQISTQQSQMQQQQSQQQQSQLQSGQYAVQNQSQFNGGQKSAFVNFQTISTQKRVEEKAKMVVKFIQELKATYEERINVLITQSQSIHITENKKKPKVALKQPQQTTSSQATTTTQLQSQQMGHSQQLQPLQHRGRDIAERPNRTFQPSTLLSRKSNANNGVSSSGGGDSLVSQHSIEQFSLSNRSHQTGNSENDVLGLAKALPSLRQNSKKSSNPSSNQSSQHNKNNTSGHSNLSPSKDFAA